MTRQPEIDVQGVRLPAIMYGTAWKEDATEALTARALGAGFRAIDTANQRRHYFEAGVGAAVAAALASGALSRSALFLQTKFTYARGQDHRLPYDPVASPREQVMQSFASSLEHLRTDHVDSFVLHGPEHGAGISPVDRDTWRAMSDLAARGQAGLLGISNVTAEQVAALCAMAKQTATARPAFVQNRCYARTGWDRDVRAVCRREGITYQGFSLLTANPHVLAHAHVQRVAARLGVTAAAAVFRFTLDLDILPLTGTRKPAHMRDDLAALDLPSLTDEERHAIEAIG
ncbi:MAG TPA: aldo/keto reductase [Polyangia bacterium]|jgi:diketogulonate reductase-like aldo/keto reductase